MVEEKTQICKNQEALSELIDEIQKKIPNDTDEIEYVVSKISLNETFKLVFKRIKNGHVL